MQQNAKFIRKLPIPMDIKKEFPVTEEVADLFPQDGLATLQLFAPSG